MTDKATFVSFLLDETGSMSSIADETVQGLNSYVEELQSSEADIVFSLVSFNSNGIERRYVAEPIRQVRAMRRRDYRPDAMTPLIDATVKIIKATDEAIRDRGDAPNVVVVVQTDGQENVSVEYDRPHLASLIKERTEAGWQFVFLGAGLDAFAAARRAGMEIDPNQVVSYGRKMSREVFAATAQNLSDYAESGDVPSLSFSKVQRARVGDRHTHKYLDPQGGLASIVDEDEKSTLDDIDLRP